MKPILILLAIVIWLAAPRASAQTVSVKLPKVYVDFVEDRPAVITIISPKELAEKSRGLRETDVKFLEIEGIVQDKDGAVTLTMNDEAVELDEDGYFIINTPLEVGKNEFKFIATDEFDGITEKTIELDRKARVIATPNGGNYYAVLFGINDYDDPSFEDLDHPIGDAEELYKVLINNYAFNKERVKLVPNPTREMIMNELDELTEKITEDDNLLIFYAGHGVFDDESEVGYWLPKDSHKEKKSAWVHNSVLRDYIKEIKSKHTLLIADACFSGSIFKSRSVSLEALPAISKLHELPSRKAMTSGTLTAVPDKSIFMKFLIKRLEDNTEPFLTAEQLFTSMKLAIMNNGDAIPLYGTVQRAGDEGGDFIFIKREEK